MYVQIENSTGTELPATGGMGTTIFYIIGGVLVRGVRIATAETTELTNEAYELDSILAAPLVAAPVLLALLLALNDLRRR